MGFEDKYLTGEKLYKIFANSKEGIDLKDKYPSIFSTMENAYMHNEDSKLLQSSTFFDEIISPETIDESTGLSVSDIHMKMLTKAYIEYHLEEVSKSIDNADSRILCLRHPEFVSEMPDYIRNNAFSKGKSYVKKCIDEVIFGNDSYDALIILSPFDQFLDKTLDDLGESLNGGEYQVKLFLKAARDEIGNEAKKTLKDADLMVVINNIDWNNDQERKQLLSMVREFSDSTEAISFPEVLKGANFTMVINSPNDVEKLEELQSSFKGANVKLNYAISPEIKGDEFTEITEKINKNPGISQNPEVQARINAINQTENISDVAGLVIDTALDGAFSLKEYELETLIDQTLTEKVGMEVKVVSDKTIEELSSAVHIEEEENLTFKEEVEESEVESEAETEEKPEEKPKKFKTVSIPHQKIREVAILGYKTNLTRKEMLELLGLDSSKKHEAVEQELSDLLMDLYDEYGEPQLNNQEIENSGVAKEESTIPEASEHEGEPTEENHMTLPEIAEATRANQIARDSQGQIK